MFSVVSLWTSDSSSQGWFFSCHAFRVSLAMNGGAAGGADVYWKHCYFMMSLITVDGVYNRTEPTETRHDLLYVRNMRCGRLIQDNRLKKTENYTTK